MSAFTHMTKYLFSLTSAAFIGAVKKPGTVGLGGCLHSELCIKLKSCQKKRNMSGIVHVQKQYREYEKAIEVLNSLQNNAAAIQQSRNDPDKAELKFLRTIYYLEKAGIQVQELSKLNAIHVSGTKGKGSTCAFTESILRAYGLKTGFYSSPHLVAVRERIRINGNPISEASFVKYFWEVYTRVINDQDPDVPPPPYFMFLTILSFHVFLQEKVDVAVLEVGIGGEYDSTNIISSPVVVGVNSISLDHVDLLGDTVEKIAWHKAGIFKPNVPAFSVPQLSSVLAVFQNRAIEKGCSLSLCPPLSAYTFQNKNFQLGVPGRVQQINASLALQLAQCWLQRTKNPSFQPAKLNCHSDTPISHAEPYLVGKDFSQGLQTCEWNGRFQTVKKGAVTYFLDGAHTSESISYCIEWFLGASQEQANEYNVFRCLLFNCTGGRKAEFLLSPLADVPFDAALFTTNISLSSVSSVSDQKNFTVEPETIHQQCIINKNIWCHLQSSLNEESALVQGHTTTTSLRNPCSSHTFSNISDALSWIEKARNNHDKTQHFSGKVHVLVTGSLHLVGGVLSLIQPP